MTPERMRIGIVATWLLAGLFIVTFIELSWTTGAVFGLLGIVPLVALFLLWHQPTQTMSQRIDAARR